MSIKSLALEIPASETLTLALHPAYLRAAYAVFRGPAIGAVFVASCYPHMPRNAQGIALPLTNFEVGFLGNVLTVYTTMRTLKVGKGLKTTRFVCGALPPLVRNKPA